MFDWFLGILADVLSVLFVIGVLICLFIVIPTTAYRLFAVLFEKDTHEELSAPEH
jgi:hypothetical protein